MTNSIEPQSTPPVAIEPYLEYVLRFLDEYELSYWMDSGSLLGIVRDGGFMEWDSDIDLGMWPEDAEKLRELAEHLRNEFFDVTERFYLGHCFGLTIRPRIAEDPDVKEIHVHVFYDTELDLAWSAQTIRPDIYNFDAAKSRGPSSFLRRAFIFMEAFAKRKAKLSLIRKRLYYFIALPIAIPLFVIKQYIDRYHWINTKPYSEIYTAGTWLVDSKYFKSLDSVKWGGLDIPIPSDVENYLVARYGKSWRKPDPTWLYYRDDGCLTLGGPEEVLPRLYKEKNPEGDAQEMVKAVGTSERSAPYFRENF